VQGKAAQPFTCSLGVAQSGSGVRVTWDQSAATGRRRRTFIEIALASANRLELVTSDRKERAMSHEELLSDSRFYRSAFGAAAISGNADEMRRIAKTDSVRPDDYPHAVETILWTVNSHEKETKALVALGVLEELGFRLTDDHVRYRQTRSGWLTQVGELIQKRVDNPEIARIIIRLGASPFRIYADPSLKFEAWRAAFELGLDSLAEVLRKAVGGGDIAPRNRLVRSCLESDVISAQVALQAIPPAERPSTLRTSSDSGEAALKAALQRAADALISASHNGTANEVADRALAVLLLGFGEAGPLQSREAMAFGAIAALAGDVSLWQDVHARMSADESYRLREQSFEEVFLAEFHTFPAFLDPVATQLILFDIFGRDLNAAQRARIITDRYSPSRPRNDELDLARLGAVLERAGEGKGEHLNVVVRVASTRTPDQQAPPPARFGSADTHGRIHFGTATVKVPLLGRKYGGLPDPWFLSRVTGHVPPGLVEVTTCQLQEDAEVPSQANSAEALVFVHGYNVSFEQALRRTAQIAVDVNTTADPWTFSWPSHGKLLAYGADADLVPGAGRALATLVEQLSVQYRCIHVYAHSTGARIIDVAAQHLATSNRRLAELVLFAGDLDADTFRANLGVMSSVCDRLTNYSSRRDRLLKLSRLIRFAPEVRVGDGVPDLTSVNPPVGNVELIDATQVDSLGVFGFMNPGHFYYGGARAVLTDLHALLKGVPAQSRPAMAYESPPPHWRLR
jgi:hypothetical protein